MKNKKGNEKTAINGKRFLIVLISAKTARAAGSTAVTPRAADVKVKCSGRSYAQPARDLIYSV